MIRKDVVVMKEFPLGTYIKKRRKDLGISQEELSEGLCAVSTLSRIENNQQNPSRNLTRHLLERLGLSKDRFFALWDQEDIAAEALVREISNDTIRWRRAQNTDQPEMRQKILEKMGRLENLADLDDPSTRQFVLAQQALLGGPEGPYGFEQRLSMQLDALRLTCPKFNLEDFQRGYYTIDETELITQIAQTHSLFGQKRRAVDIYRQLLWYIEKHNKELAGYASHFCLVTHNYAICLDAEKRYMDAIEIAERGRRACIDYGDYHFLPGFLAIQAECWYFLGENRQSRELYTQAYYMYKAYEDEANRKIIQREIQKHLGIKLPE